MSGTGSSVFDITQSLGADDAGVSAPARGRREDSGPAARSGRVAQIDAAQGNGCSPAGPGHQPGSGLAAMLFRWSAIPLTASTSLSTRSRQSCMRSERARPSTWCRRFPCPALARSEEPPGLNGLLGRSHTIAQLAMLIADERQTVCNILPDQTYLAGIFHDCGVPC